FLNRFPDLSPTEKLNGLVGLANGMRAIASLLLMCDPRDLGIAVTEDIAQGQKQFEPDLFLYDNYPGGIGQSAPLYELRRKLLDGTAQLLAACPCESGCPSCVGPAGDTGDGAKNAAQRFLIALREQSAAAIAS